MTSAPSVTRNDARLRAVIAPILPRRQRGVALVAVLWLVAALSVLGAAMSQVVRVDARIASNAFDRASARALLDGGLRLAAADVLADAGVEQGIRVRRYRIAEAHVQVEIVPALGLISLNAAPESLLFDLFKYGAGVSDVQAQRLTQGVVAWRGGTGVAESPAGDAEQPATPAPGARNEYFLHPDDLSQVPGMSQAVHDKISPLLSLSLGAGGRVNPYAAPIGVLEVLAHGNTALANAIADERGGAAAERMDFAGLDPRHIVGAQSREYRLTARMERGDGTAWQRVAWLTPMAAANPSAEMVGGSRWLYASDVMRVGGSPQ
jgi:general secretion pathway protein K